MKERSMKIGNYFLLGGVLLETIALVLFLLPFKDNKMGLEVALGEGMSILALLSFIFVAVSVVVSLLIFIDKNFPWGKILLKVLALLAIAAGTLLFFINGFMFGAILVATLNYLAAITFTVAAVKK